MIKNLTLAVERQSIITKEKAILLTKSINEIHEPQTYDKAISNLIYSRYWKEVIEEELQNLENHQTWEYDELPQTIKR